MATESTDDICPEKFNLAATYVVQALETRYIRSDVLSKVLDQMWGAGNWALETRLSYHVIVVPRKLSSDEIHALQRKSNNAKPAEQEAGASE